MNELQQLVDRMEPEEALAELVPHVKQLLSHLNEEATLRFVTELIGGENNDKITSMVNLWLAECMDEGVDPTHMCQTLVHKIAQSKQLMSVTDPDILALFETWLEELEEEVANYLKEYPAAEPVDIATGLGLSRSGAKFLLAKVQREGKT